MNATKSCEWEVSRFKVLQKIRSHNEQNVIGIVSTFGIIIALRGFKTDFIPFHGLCQVQVGIGSFNLSLGIYHCQLLTQYVTAVSNHQINGLHQLHASSDTVVAI